MTCTATLQIAVPFVIQRVYRLDIMIVFGSLLCITFVRKPKDQGISFLTLHSLSVRFEVITKTQCLSVEN